MLRYNDAFFDHLRTLCRNALDEYGQQNVAQIQEMLSVPIETDAEGNVLARSAPGEPPRMEYGVLRENIHAEPSSGTTSESVTLIAMRPPLPPAGARITGHGRYPESDPYAAVDLEEMNRPYMSRQFEFVRTEGLGVIHGLMRAGIDLPF